MYHLRTDDGLMIARLGDDVVEKLLATYDNIDSIKNLENIGTTVVTVIYTGGVQLYGVEHFSILINDGYYLVKERKSAYH